MGKWLRYTVAFNGTLLSREFLNRYIIALREVWFVYIRKIIKKKKVSESFVESYGRLSEEKGTHAEHSV